jgi:hypothetical protein
MYFTYDCIFQQKQTRGRERVMWKMKTGKYVVEELCQGDKAESPYPSLCYLF